MSVSVNPPTVEVVVRTAEDVLSSLTASDIGVRVDLTSLGPGTYQLPPMVSLPPNVQWVRVEPDRVTVVITASVGTPVATPLSNATEPPLLRP